MERRDFLSALATIPMVPVSIKGVTPEEPPIEANAGFLRLAPGDILVLTMPERINAEVRQRIGEHVKAILPPHCKILVLDPGTQVGVIRPED